LTDAAVIRSGGTPISVSRRATFSTALGPAFHPSTSSSSQRRSPKSAPSAGTGFHSAMMRPM
jgi:hypothetical protein